MGQSCDIIPQVKGADGREHDSKLFTSIMGILPEYQVRNMYNLLKSDNFKNTEEYQHLDFDEYGEPTLESLFKNTDFSKQLSEFRISKRIYEKLGVKKEATIESTPKAMADAISNIIHINNELDKATDGSQYFRVALIRDDSNNIKYHVYRANEKSNLWEYSLKEYSEDIQKLMELQENGLVTTLLARDVFAKSLNTLPKNEDKIGLFNAKVISGLLNETKEKIAKKEKTPINPRKISDSNSNQRLYSICSLFDTNIYRNFCISHGLEFNEAEYNKDKSKYTNLMLDTLMSEYLTGMVKYDFLQGHQDIEHCKNMVERLGEEIKSKWQKINLPDYSKKVDVSVSELPNPENSEHFISISKIIQDMGDDYWVVDKTRDLAAQILKNIIATETQQVSILSGYIKHQENEYEDIEYDEEGNEIEKNEEVLELVERKQLINDLQELYEEGSYEVAVYNYYNSLQKKIKEYQNQLNKPYQEVDLLKRSDLLRKVNSELQMFNDISSLIEKNLPNMAFDKIKLTEDIQRIITNATNKNIDTLLAEYRESESTFASLYPEMITDFIEAYINIQNLRNDTGYEELNGQFTVVAKQLQIKVDEQSKKVLASVLEQYQDEEARTVAFGKNKGKKMDIEQLLTKAERDMWGVERLLDAMGDTPDIILRLIDKIVKQYKNKARINAIKWSKEIAREAKILENAGIRDTKWMFSRYSNGEKTGRYVRSGDPEMIEILNNPAKYRFYKFFMETKQKFDNMYPPNTIDHTQIISIRKDFMERAKESGSLKGAAEAYWKDIKDDWTNNNQQSEEELAGYRQAFVTLDGEEIKTLPVFYNQVDFTNQESINEISEDAVSTLISWGAKALDYNGMNEIVSTLELSKHVLKQREIPVEKNGFKVLSAIKKQLLDEEDSIEDAQVYYKDGGKSNLYKRLDGYLDMAVYNRVKTDDKQIGKFSVTKIVDKLNAWTARASMSLSLLNGVSNVTTGNAMMTYEALASHYFKPSDLLWADGTYARHSVAMLGNLGNRIKDDKLSLFTELFDVTQDYDKEPLDIKWDKKTKMGRIEMGKAMMFIQDAGEHWMSHRTALCVAHTYKLKDKDGNLHNLWESLEVKYIQEDGSLGSENKGLGAKLQVKEGYTKEDGTRFTENDVLKLQLKMASINQGMHGIYNKLDANLIQRTALGRAAYLFRKWMWKSYSKRFSGINYNYNVGEWDEGYYTSTLRFMTTLAKDLKQFKFDVMLHWDELHPTEKANCKRALYEILGLIAIMTFNAMVDWEDDDDDEDNWLRNFTMYQSVRLQSELSALTPISFIGETVRLFKSPLPAINTVMDILNTWGALWIPNWFEEVDRGWAKGHSKGFKLLFGNKVLNPYYHVMYRNANAEEFYQNFVQ